MIAEVFLIIVCGSIMGTICFCKTIKYYINKYPSYRNKQNSVQNIIYVVPPIYTDEPPPPYSEKQD